MLQDVIHQHELNHPLWSVAVEWKIYFLFPLLLIAWERFGGALTALVAVCVSLLAFGLLTGRDLQGLTPHYVGLFTLGMLAAAIAHEPASLRVPWRAVGLGLSALAALLIELNCGQHLSWERCAVLDTIVGASTACALVVMASSPGGFLRRALSAKPLVLVGTFSYSLYLIHAPLQHVLWQYAVRPLGLPSWATFALLAGVGTPVLVGISWVFYRLCEKPFIPGQVRDKVMVTRPVASTCVVEKPNPS
jgi:peptidoglycan/LPS O-acetylase OafA/YrhL